MIPTETRLVFLSYLALGLSEFLFGILYNWLIDNADRFPQTRALTAWSVVIGDTVTLLLVVLFFQSSEMWITIGTVFYGYVWSGVPMIVGHRNRYVRALKVEKDKKRRLLPNWMLPLRDGAADDAMAVLHLLKSFDPNNRDVERARRHLTSIVAKMIQAGAQVRAEDL